MSAVQSGDLKRFLDAKKKPSRLLGDVERWLQKQPWGDRSTLVLHPSEIIKKDFCRRGSFHLLSGAKKAGEKPALRLQNIFDEGHYVHAKWQRRFQDMGILYGNFQCQVCDNFTWGLSPDECAACGASNRKLVYEEVTLRDDDLRIKGHTDGWIKDDRPDTLIEIKSIGPGTIRAEAPQLFTDSHADFMKAWGNINRPFPSHIMQGQMYLELMKRMGNPVDQITFIYELKADQSVKEFTVQADYELVRHVFDMCEELVKDVEYKDEPVCTNNPGGTCKQCAPYVD